MRLRWNTSMARACQENSYLSTTLRLYTGCNMDVEEASVPVKGTATSQSQASGSTSNPPGGRVDRAGLHAPSATARRQAARELAGQALRAGDTAVLRDLVLSQDKPTCVGARSAIFDVAEAPEVD